LRYGISARSSSSHCRLLAVYLIQLGWVKLCGAGYLLYLVYRHFGGSENLGARSGQPKPVAWMTRLATVGRELTDVVFGHRFDPGRGGYVAQAVGDPDGRILGIIMMAGHRQLLALVERYPALVDGAFVIIAWSHSKPSSSLHARITSPLYPKCCRSG